MTTTRPAALGFEVTRSRRKTLAIMIRPDGSVRVAAPRYLPQWRIEDAVAAKSDWIAKKRREIAEHRPPSPPKRYVDGEPHLYLGVSYPLRLTRGPRGQVALGQNALGQNALRITAPDPNNGEAVKALLAKWYHRRSAVVLPERFNAHLPLTEELGLTRPHLVLRHMRRTWGNCRPSGRITLNRELVRAPVDCIDYVIAHEICHLRHANHSKAYYAMLDEVRPDWRDRKAELERVMA